MGSESIAAGVSRAQRGFLRMTDRAVKAADFKAASIDLYITSACNRRCSYCFLSDSFLSSNLHMSLEMAQGILAWATLGGTIDEVTLLGGEPASHPAFYDFVAIAAAHRVKLRTVTNGSRRFRESLADEAIRSSFSRVAVSLDSTVASVVDQLRGDAASADALATIEQLRALGVPFDINCTVVASALDSFPDMLRFADVAGADRINVHWFSTVGRGRHYASGQAVSAAQWRDQVLEPAVQYRPTRDNFTVDCELGFAFGLPGEDTNMCAVRDRTNLQFFPDGTVFSCGIAVEDPGLSGYLWRAGKLRQRRGHSEHSLTSVTCRGCPLREPTDDFVPVCVYNRLALS